MSNYERIFRVIGLLLLTIFLGVYFVKVNILDLQVILTLGVGMAVVDTLEK